LSGGIGKVVFGGPERTGVAPLSAGFPGEHELVALTRLITTKSMISFDNSINFESLRCAATVKAEHSTLTCILGYRRIQE